MPNAYHADLRQSHKIRKKIFSIDAHISFIIYLLSSQILLYVTSHAIIAGLDRQVNKQKLALKYGDDGIYIPSIKCMNIVTHLFQKFYLKANIYDGSR